MTKLKSADHIKVCTEDVVNNDRSIVHKEKHTRLMSPANRGSFYKQYPTWQHICWGVKENAPKKSNWLRLWSRKIKTKINGSVVKVKQRCFSLSLLEADMVTYEKDNEVVQIEYWSAFASNEITNANGTSYHADHWNNDFRGDYTGDNFTVVDLGVNEDGIPVFFRKQIDASPIY